MLGKIGNEIHYHSKENPILLATSHNNKLEIWNLGLLHYYDQTVHFAQNQQVTSHNPNI